MSFDDINFESKPRGILHHQERTVISGSSTRTSTASHFTRLSSFHPFLSKCKTISTVDTEHTETSPKGTTEGSAKRIKPNFQSTALATKPQSTLRFATDLQRMYNNGAVGGNSLPRLQNQNPKCKSEQRQGLSESAKTVVIDLERRGENECISQEIEVISSSSSISGTVNCGIEEIPSSSEKLQTRYSALMFAEKGVTTDSLDEMEQQHEKMMLDYSSSSSSDNSISSKETAVPICSDEDEELSIQFVTKNSSESDTAANSSAVQQDDIKLSVDTNVDELSALFDVNAEGKEMKKGNGRRSGSGSGKRRGRKKGKRKEKEDSAEKKDIFPVVDLNDSSQLLIDNPSSKSLEKAQPRIDLLESLPLSTDNYNEETVEFLPSISTSRNSSYFKQPKTISFDRWNTETDREQTFDQEHEQEASLKYFYFTVNGKSRNLTNINRVCTFTVDKKEIVFRFRTDDSIEEWQKLDVDDVAGAFTAPFKLQGDHLVWIKLKLQRPAGLTSTLFAMESVDHLRSLALIMVVDYEAKEKIRKSFYKQLETVSWELVKERLEGWANIDSNRFMIRSHPIPVRTVVQRTFRNVGRIEEVEVEMKPNSKVREYLNQLDTTNQVQRASKNQGELCRKKKTNHGATSHISIPIAVEAEHSYFKMSSPRSLRTSSPSKYNFASSSTSIASPQRRSRLSSTHASADKVILTYPLDKAASGNKTTLYQSDLMRLQPNVFLNDSLLQLYLIWLEEQYAANCNVLFFNTHFYSKLASEGCQSVEKWHRGRGNILERRYWVVPINEALHWYLCIVCFPGAFYNFHYEPSSCFFYEANAPVTYIIVLNSLRNYAHTTENTVGVKIKNFISAIAAAADVEQAAGHTFVELYPETPQQTNTHDCGCFLLQNVETFLSAGTDNSLMRFINGERRGRGREELKGYDNDEYNNDDKQEVWYEVGKARKKRAEISDLIERLQQLKSIDTAATPECDITEREEGDEIEEITEHQYKKEIMASD